jgi:tetratricopeptide (TPR) repeat protein
VSVHAGALRIAWVALAVVSLTAHAAPRHAPDTPERKLAAAEFKRGKQLYAAGDNEGALQAFQAGFNAYPLRGFLVNIAQCQRRLGHLKEAVAAYQRFLDATDVPASLRSEVEEAVAEVKAAQAAAAPDLEDAPPKPVPRAIASDEEAPPPAPSSGATLPSDAEVKKSPPEKKRRAWVWALVGVGAAAVVGGVTAGVILGTRSASPRGGSLGLIDGRTP